MSTLLPAWRYPLPMRLIHWSSAVLVLVAYLTGDDAEDGGGWHMLAGVLLLALFVPRVLAYGLPRRPPALQPAPSRPERLAAVSVHGALLLFVLVQPLLGLLSVWAGGDAVGLPGGVSLASPLVIDPGWHEGLEELHEGLGTVFYVVIGVHVLAALWHQWVRRDGVMRRML